MSDSDSSSDEIIGQEAEKEYGDHLDRMGNVHSSDVQAPVKKPSKKGLPISQRLKLIDEYRQGKIDKFYNVVPIKNKPGEFRVVKRRKPLDVPIVDSEPNIDMSIKQPEPVQTTKPVENEPVIDKNKFVMPEFYNMQNTINNSLSKEIAAVMEKCNRIEAKMKKQKAKMKQQRRMKQPEPEEYEYEMDEEPVELPTFPEEPEPQPMFFSPFSVRKRIDLRNF